MTTNSIVLADNAFGTLGSGLAVGDTALTFTTGHGARFPAVVAGQVLYCCLLNSSNIIEEIQVTAHAAGADSATIVRGANSTTAKVWNSGDLIQARLSSEVIRRVNQESLPESTIVTADAGATYTGTTSPTRLGYITGIIYALTTATTNGGASPTIALDSLAAITVKLNSGAALSVGQMPIHGLYMFDGTNFLLMNPIWTSITNTLGGNVAINNAGSFFDAASCAQGSAGTWLATGYATFQDTSGAANFTVKLTDGTNDRASGFITAAISTINTLHLSASFPSPPGNIRIQVRDASSLSGNILFNISGLQKDSQLTVTRTS